MERLDATGYLAARGFTPLVTTELGTVTDIHDRLVLSPGPARTSYWSQNVWHEPHLLHFDSITQAAKALRAVQRNWCLYSFLLHRRARLIQEQLPAISAKPRPFPCTLPTAPLGSWSLIDAHTLIASPACSSPFPHGEIAFNEDHTGPPSRAYLKLWETFTLTGRMPGPGDFCIDLGASPGGWTWVLAGLGARVLAVDRSPLCTDLMQHPAVTFRSGNAFAVKPAEFDRVDWLFSDVACYPEKLYDYVQTWLETGICRNLVATIKFQGDSHYGVIAQFAAIPGSRIMHLGCNGHELTWVWTADGK